MQAAARFMGSMMRPAATRPAGLVVARLTEPSSRIALPPPLPSPYQPSTETLKVLGFPSQINKPLPHISPMEPKRRVFGDWADSVLSVFEALNRNARKPKKANHGRRPCSSVVRKQRRRVFGKKSK